MKVLELFGGIGACTSALKRLGLTIDVVDYVEIDKYACASYNAINGTDFEVQDVCKWDKDIDVDLIMHGSPCQDFSVAGNNAGGDKGSGTRSSLMYETIRIVDKLRPKYVVWENVKNLLSAKHRHNFEAYLETMKALGYTNYYQVLNAKDYGIPQNRERVFTISVLGTHDSFMFPSKQPLELRLKDLLEDDVDEKYYVSSQLELKNNNSIRGCVQIGMLNIKGMDCVRRVYSDEGLSPTLTNMQGGNRQPKVVLKSKCKRLASLVEKTNFEEGKVLNMDLYNQSTYENISQCLTEPHHNSQRLFDGYRIRKLTPRECWRLMGFSDEDFEKAAKVNSNTQLYKQAGNSIVVNVLVGIFKNLFEGDVLNVNYRKDT